MKFTILGAGSGLPHTDYNSSSILVQTSFGNFLADCGEGTSRQLLKNGIAINDIDAILISHYHPDHVSGIYMLLQMFYLLNRTKPLKLFIPERISAFIDSMHQFYLFQQKFHYDLEILEMDSIRKNYQSIAAVQNDHLHNYIDFINKYNYPNSLKSFSFSFSDDGKNLVYTSDINTIKELSDILNKASCVIIDALHPQADKVISIADNPDRLIILTHGISLELESWLSKNNYPNIIIAVENKTYAI